MIKSIILFIRDFKDYLLVRRLNRIVVLDGTHARIVRAYDKEVEKELDWMVLHKLAEEMVGGSITPDFYRWARSALMWRMSYLWVSNHKFPLNIKTK